MTTRQATAVVRRLVLAALLLPTSLSAQRAASDTIRAERFDLGRMWTFEYPPAAYFSQTYGFSADSAWFAAARMASLRIPGCSAAFVSPNGLIATNHHCVRGAVSAVSRRGETLLDSGFVARALDEERRIPNYYADQLIAAIDVSDEMNAAVDAAREGPERDRVRAATSAAIADRLRQRHAVAGDSIWVQVVALYNGARTSAYVFRRYTDIRLVVAAELQMGFFGGDWDNFTYPRYALDFAILRAYGRDGRPVQSGHWFRWGAGVRPGEPVFVIGNPGQTSRLTTIAQLEYQRDVALPPLAAFLRSRLAAMAAWGEANRGDAERLDLRNRMFGLSNSLKSLDGRLLALRDPAIIARRADSERMLRDSIRARSELRVRYGRLFDELAALQRAKARHATGYRAFSQLLNPGAGSGTLQRAFWSLRIEAGPQDSVAFFRERMGRVPNWPADLERALTRLALEDIARAYGPNHPFTRALPDSAAVGSLSDSAARVLLAPMLPAILETQRELAALARTEADLAARIGRARFEVYGPAIPPDGSFSPRIADGVVQGYEYNGTLAPPYTTFYGMYDRHRAHGGHPDWELPMRWRRPPDGLDLGTPLNFVSTADTYGGNSGSPVVTRELRLVGLNFDRNVDALVRDYLYLPERGRNIMVDVRAILAALDVVYDADRVARELVTGRLFSTEAEADSEVIR
ncbi:MAG TPA: S46 family peptidase [Gemmatimonadales bacterium]|nr:S46 family peptidase [Gemmatimonadales bacterium]